MSAVELAVLARRRYAAPTQGFGMVIVDRAEDKDIAMADEPGSKATLFSTDVTDDDSFNAAIEQANWVSPEIVEAFYAAAGWSAASLSYWIGAINAAELCRRRVL